MARLSVPGISHFLHSIRLDGEAGMDEPYHFQVPAIRQLREKELLFHPKVTFLVGENGSGKSTLIESIAEKLGFSIDGGTRNTNLAQHVYRSPLSSALTLSRTHLRPMDGFFLRAESYYNFATLLDEEKYGTWSYGGKSLHEQSHGEAFLATLNHRLGGNGVYVFDEPEAALSPQRQLSLLARMHDLVSEYSQFVIATHSPILMAYPEAWIYQFGPDGFERVEYEDTDHFQITRLFMNDRESMMKRLFADRPRDD